MHAGRLGNRTALSFTRLEAWLTYGPPRDCIAHLQRDAASGCRCITFRISTMGDPMAQLRRPTTEEVLPYVGVGADLPMTR